MTDLTDETKHIEKLYEFGERLNESKDKSQNVKDYQGIIDAAKSSIKAKQLAAQLIPRFFKFFPDLSGPALECHLDLLEEEDLGVRVQAIRGLPLFCKDTPEYVPKIVYILMQLLAAEDFVERDAVNKALMSLLRQDVKASLTTLFGRIANMDEPESGELIRDKILNFIRDKVFPAKAELLKPQEEMERHITDLIKKSLEDVTGAEFRMFMDFLKSLSLFGDKAPPDRMKELVGLIEAQADLDAQFKDDDADHIDRLISCLFMALPFFIRGTSSSKFLNYLNKEVLPVIDKLPEERKLDMLKALAEISPYTTPQDSRQILSPIVQLLKKYMPRRKTGEEMNFTYVECLLYAFHHLAHKAPNATNSLCGYKIVTGQPSDRLGEDFTEQHKEFIERLNVVEELTRATMKKLTQGMAEHNKAMAAAKSEDEKNKVKTQKQNTTSGLRTCNNILAMTKPLHSKTPSFIGDKSITLSWKEATQASAPAATNTPGGKRPASTVSGSALFQQIRKKKMGFFLSSPNLQSMAMSVPLPPPASSSSSYFLRHKPFFSSPLPLPLRPQTRPLKSSSPFLFRTQSKGSNSADAPDRLISAVCYFYPFFDGVQYGKYVVTQFSPIAALIQPLLPAIKAFKSFPFNGFLVFLTLYFVVVRNTNFSRYVRFNTMQAIVLDVLLIFPDLLERSFNPRDGVGLDLIMSLDSTVFLFLLVCLIYGSSSCLLGQVPRLPLVAEAADRQVL